MKSLLLIMLAGYAVRCDDSNYYVIHMPENDTPVKDVKKPFKVYWNVPTMQCKSKRIQFENLYEQYGILQNKNDSFRGEEISILYDPGLFPALLKNESSGKLKFRNGGVPQEGDLDKHLETFRSVLDQSIPDPRFSGVGIIDFESWRPIFRQNFGVLVPYKDVSYEIEKKLHWWWPKQWLQTEAKQRFEESARVFMQTTLSEAKQMRPNALWGYYGFPYCFNVANNNMKETCAEKVPEENNRIYWLWSESTALYPSVYSSRDLKSSQLASLIRGRVREAERVKRKGTLVLPYFWFRYREGGYLSERDLQIALETLYKSNAAGFIIWGSSNDVNTVAKCKKLLEYTKQILGPAIAKYTKPSSELQDEMPIDIQQDDKTTTEKTVSIESATNLDPEFHWEPPENYTQDIVLYVEEEIKNNSYNITDKDKYINETFYNNLNDSVLIDAIVNSLIEKERNNTDSRIAEIRMTNSQQKVAPFVVIPKVSYETTDTYHDLEASQTMNSPYTINLIPNKNNKKGTPRIRKPNVDLTNTESITYSEITTNVYDIQSTMSTEKRYDSTTNHKEYKDFELQTKGIDLFEENDNTKTTSNENYKYTTTEDNFIIEVQFFNHNTFYVDEKTTLNPDTHTTEFETTTSIPNITTKQVPLDIINETTTKEITESSTNESTTEIDLNKESQVYESTDKETNETFSNVSTTSALEQVVVHIL